MVKQGFLNLSEAERQRVIEAALDEFAQHDFASASLNRIIQNAGISKGSMYHYFYSKEDLYLYILDVIADHKKAFMARAMSELGRPLQNLGFFDILQFQLKVGIAFAVENPRLQLIGENLEKTDPVFRATIMARMGGQLEDYLSAMVDAAIAKGEIRDDLDRDFIFRVFGLVLINFRQMYPEALTEAIDAEQLKRNMEQLVSFLKNGLQKQSVS